VCLSLDSLPYHNWVTVSFDVYVIRSWNGNVISAGGNAPLTQDVLAPNVIVGPDKWQLDAAGQTLLLTTFANYPEHDQAYPGWYPGSSYPSSSGALEQNTLGYIWDSTPMDAVYRLSFTFLHNGETLEIDFSGMGLQALSDESWGLDNVRVELLAGLRQVFLPLLEK
jgi:hypothetical protein